MKSARSSRHHLRHRQPTRTDESSSHRLPPGNLCRWGSAVSGLLTMGLICCSGSSAGLKSLDLVPKETVTSTVFGLRHSGLVLMTVKILGPTMSVALETRGNHAPPKKKCDWPVAARHSFVCDSGGGLGALDSSRTVRNGHAEYRATSSAQRDGGHSRKLFADSGRGGGVHSTSLNNADAPTLKAPCMRRLL